MAGALVHADQLSEYVNECKQQLQFSAAEIPPLNCNNGFLFDGNGATGDRNRINDYVGYARVNENVDLAFACRWLENRWPANSKTGPFLDALSIELMIHNRTSGNTCFFAAKPGPLKDPDGENVPVQPEGVVSTTIVSPTAANASAYWMQPTELDTQSFNSDPNQRLRCVGCHVAGPYIASPNITPFLARFGLLNNGHDTAPHPDINKRRYHAVGTAFSAWNQIVTSFNSPKEQTCANGCHSIGYGSTIASIGGPEGQSLIPSLSRNIGQVLAPPDPVMPPGSPNSDYHWINLDTPGNGVETENFADAKNATLTAVPKLLNDCAAPTVMEAHVVGSENEFVVSESSRFALLADRLATFNLKDGLVCLNGDQEPGHQCQDYKIRYECTDATGKKTWTGWYNMDSPTGDGDHEDRYKDKNLCTSPSGSKTSISPLPVVPGESPRPSQTRC